MDPDCIFEDSSKVSEVGVMIRSPFDKHSSLEIALKPRSMKAWSETLMPTPIPDSNETLTPFKAVILQPSQDELLIFDLLNLEILKQLYA